MDYNTPGDKILIARMGPAQLKFYTKILKIRKKESLSIGEETWKGS